MEGAGTDSSLCAPGKVPPLLGCMEKAKSSIVGTYQAGTVGSWVRKGTSSHLSGTTEAFRGMHWFLLITQKSAAGVRHYWLVGRNVLMWV